MKLKEYLVTNMYATANMLYPEPMEESPMSIYADSPESAIEQTIELILGHTNTDYITEREGNVICVYDLYGNFVEMLMDFVATEIDSK